MDFSFAEDTDFMDEDELDEVADGDMDDLEEDEVLWNRPLPRFGRLTTCCSATIAAPPIPVTRVSMVGG